MRHVTEAVVVCFEVSDTPKERVSSYVLQYVYCLTVCLKCLTVCLKECGSDTSSDTLKEHILRRTYVCIDTICLYGCTGGWLRVTRHAGSGVLL